MPTKVSRLTHSASLNQRLSLRHRNCKMHSENISFLFLIPLLFLALGIYFMIGGLRRQLDSGFFRRAFLFYFFGTFSMIFVVQILKANKLDTIIINSELDNIFIFSTYGVAVFAAFGFLYFYFNNFVPMIFIRGSILLSAFAIIVGAIVTYNKATAPEVYNTGQFQEVKDGKGGPPQGTFQPQRPY